MHMNPASAMVRLSFAAVGYPGCHSSAKSPSPERCKCLLPINISAPGRKENVSINV